MGARSPEPGQRSPVVPLLAAEFCQLQLHLAARRLALSGPPWTSRDGRHHTVQVVEAPPEGGLSGRTNRKATSCWRQQTAWLTAWLGCIKEKSKSCLPEILAGPNPFKGMEKQAM